MKISDIISAHKEKDDSIILTVVDHKTGTHDSRRFADIRMGIHWPTSLSPACLVVVSQEFTGTHNNGEAEIQIGKRELIAEHISESLGMNGFYDQIVEIKKKTLCRRIYAVLPDDRFACGQLQDLQKFARRSASDIYVHEVKDGGDFFLSISRIKDSIDGGNLLIPEDSVVWDQLNIITRSDLQDIPEQRFYCIDALGNVLDGYYSHPPRNYPLITRKRKPPDWRYH